jgi:hypothetical protein
MKRFAMLALATLGVALSTTAARADWGKCCPGGGLSAKLSFWTRHLSKHASCNKDEERWQKFWHDYYDALQKYYDRLDNLDWVTYYKYHGYVTNGGAACGPHGQSQAQYAPVVVNPMMQWAAPYGAPSGNGAMVGR